MGTRSCPHPWLRRCVCVGGGEYDSPEKLKDGNEVMCPWLRRCVCGGGGEYDS